MSKHLMSFQLPAIQMLRQDACQGLMLLPYHCLQNHHQYCTTVGILLVIMSDCCHQSLNPPLTV